MPLRDHFRPPTTKSGSWESLHGMWPAVFVQQLRTQLPLGFVSAPRVHLGPYFEIDIAAFDKDGPSAGNGSGSGGTATLAPPRPTWPIETDVPEEDEYEVRIYNAEEERQLENRASPWRLCASAALRFLSCWPSEGADKRIKRKAAKAQGRKGGRGGSGRRHRNRRPAEQGPPR